MSRPEEATLRQLDICEHRYPSVVVVPHKETFVLARWCMKCGEALFDMFDEDETDQSEIHMEEL